MFTHSRPQDASSLDLVIAGTSEAVLMIEGFCDFLTEEQMLEVRRAALRCAALCCAVLGVGLIRFWLLPALGGTVS